VEPGGWVYQPKSLAEDEEEEIKNGSFNREIFKGLAKL